MGNIYNHDDCDDLIENFKVSEQEISDAVKVVLEKYKPVCINKNGLSVLDDVGGLSGFSRLLWDIYESEDRQTSSSMRAWAKGLGWSSKKVSIKKIL